jgi:cell division protein FtsW (lipid II flippase)
MFDLKFIIPSVLCAVGIVMFSNIQLSKDEYGQSLPPRSVKQQIFSFVIALVLVYATLWIMSEDAVEGFENIQIGEPDF